MPTRLRRRLFALSLPLLLAGCTLQPLESQPNEQPKADKLPGKLPEAAKEFEKSDAYATYIEDNVMQANALYGDDFTEYLEGNTADLEKVLVP